jgi:hypothetical protein
LGSKTQQGTSIRRSAALVPHNARFFGGFLFLIRFVTLEHALVYVEKVRHRFFRTRAAFWACFLRVPRLRDS